MSLNFPDTIFDPVDWARPEDPVIPSDFELIPDLKEWPLERMYDLLLTPFRQWHIPRTPAQTLIRNRAESLIRKALRYAIAAHKGQERSSGGPYIIHPVNAAWWMAQHGERWQAIVSTLLHDVPEDWQKSVKRPRFLPLQRILDQFGEEVMYQVFRQSNLKFRGGQMYDPWSLEYYRPETHRDEEHKERHGGDLMDSKRVSMFRGPAYDFRSEPPAIRKVLLKIRRRLGVEPHFINPLDLEAIMGKGADSVHNLKTLGHMDEEEQLKRRQKPLRLALGIVLPAMDPKFSKYFDRERESAPFSFMRVLSDRKRLNLLALGELPHPDDPIINVHGSGSERDVLVPHSGFGKGELVHDRIYLELLKRVEALGGRVHHDQSIMAHGRRRFEAFRVDLNGKLGFSDLSRALRHVYLRYANDPFASNAADFQVNHLHCAYQSDERNYLAVYVPNSHYPLANFQAKKGPLDLFDVGGLETELKRFQKGHAEFPLKFAHAEIPVAEGRHPVLYFHVPAALRQNEPELKRHLEFFSRHLARMGG